MKDGINFDFILYKCYCFVAKLCSNDKKTVVEQNSYSWSTFPINSAA